jgi:hypothetical protein
MTSVQWICAGSVLDRRLPDRFSSPLRPSAQVSMVTKTTCLSGEKNVLVWPIPAKGKRTQGINPQRSAPSLGYQLPSAASPTRHGFLCTHLHLPRRPALLRRLAVTPHHFPNYPASRPHYLSDPADSLPLKPPPLPPLFLALLHVRTNPYLVSGFFPSLQPESHGLGDRERAAR